MHIREVLGSIKARLGELLNAEPWLKVAASGLLGAIGGSTFIGFLNRYALYNYAVGYGGRLPVEGVPYLDLAVSILSFAFFGASVLGAVLIYATLTFISSKLSKIVSTKRRVFMRLLSAILTSALTNLGVTLAVAIYTGKLKTPAAIIPVVLMSMITITLVIVAVWPSTVRWISIGVTIIVILFVASRLFVLSNYASFLREIRYGGGISVSLTVSDASGKLLESEGYLFLTTEEKYVLVERGSSFSEIPRSNVQTFRYHDKRDRWLPDPQGSLVNLFQHLWHIKN